MGRSIRALPASSVAPPKRFTLAGPSRLPDPRINAYRPDLADIRVAERVFAPHYAGAHVCACVAPAAMLREAPNAAAEAVSQLLRGESFELLDHTGDWAWGRTAHDGYVGYLPASALGAVTSATHRIIVREAFLFERPDIKSPTVALWPIGARFAGRDHHPFIATGSGFIHVRHSAPIEAPPVDPVDIASRLLGAPYLWGGRGGGGIDCSGLVQLAWSFAGVDVPRDSDQQRAIGADIADDAPLQRGDLLFFPGHVGMMVSPRDMIHANAYRMAVTVEPLDDVIARLAPDHARPVLARRRATW